ncbi:MAG: response regulator [Alphaproteobacteria bacterium]
MAYKISDLTVLIIDDEPSVTRLLNMMLRDLKVAQVFIAKDGRDALDFLGSFDDAGVNFIICDWNMPRMSGIELLQQFRTVDPDVPFVMLTGRNDMDSVTSARDLGVTGYLLKPFSQEQLEGYLTSVLDKDITAA